MDTEIELKFLISQAVQGQLDEILSAVANVKSHRQSHLKNTYFDTQDRALRHADIGLRLRTNEQRTVQTVKTAGVSSGGLHQRPEYNIEVELTSPDLGLFDPDIWPENFDLDKVQSALCPLFTTDFIRDTYLVSFDGDTDVEIACDRGEIVSGDSGEPICELELELVSGTIEGLFRLAHALSERLPLRLSDQSKAARGYRLLNGTSLEVKQSLGVVPLTQQDTVEDAFIKTLDYGLNFWQHHEACYFASPSLDALRRVLDAIALIRHSFWLFSFAIDRTTSDSIRSEIRWLLGELAWVEDARQIKALTSPKGNYRRKLDKSEALLRQLKQARSEFPDDQQMQALFSSGRYTQLILNLVEWLQLRRWRIGAESDLSELRQQKMAVRAQSLMQFSWDEVRQGMPQHISMQASDYLDKHKLLSRSLLTGSCLGALFERETRQVFRRPWIDIHQAVDELELLVRLQKVADSGGVNAADRLGDWLEKKQDNLLSALEQSRLSALKLEPYWEE